jgi:hypothetical protein
MVVDEDLGRAAFGLQLRIDPRISVTGLGLGMGLGQRTGPAALQPPSRIRLDAAELDRRWKTLTSAPIRTREVRFGETLVRSVDFGEPAGHLLWIHGCGRVLISPDGTELLCAPDASSADWTSMIASQALPLAATIRGLEVMHASGVVLDGDAMLFVGPSGIGKSSLAAALVRRGASLLSDDAIALSLNDGALIAHPGSAALHLRPAEEDRLGCDEISALGRPAGLVEGRRRYVSAQVAEAAQLAHVFMLERSERDPIVEPLHAVDPFELIGSTFNVSVRTAERLARQLDFVSAIASCGLAHRLRIRPDVDASSLAELVHEHVRGKAATQRGRSKGRRRCLP